MMEHDKLALVMAIQSTMDHMFGWATLQCHDGGRNVQNRMPTPWLVSSKVDTFTFLIISTLF